MPSMKRIACTGPHSTPVLTIVLLRPAAPHNNYVQRDRAMNILQPHSVTAADKGWSDMSLSEAWRAHSTEKAAIMQCLANHTVTNAIRPSTSRLQYQCNVEITKKVVVANFRFKSSAKLF